MTGFDEEPLYEVTVHYGIHFPVSELIKLGCAVHDAMEVWGEDLDWHSDEVVFPNVPESMRVNVSEAIEERERLTGWSLGQTWREQGT